MSRIKIRVSAGVFEVSLLRVIDETKSVEVLWDRGVKREFKWGSVVFGSTDGQTVGQKPTELVSDTACKFVPVFFVSVAEPAFLALASQSVMTFPQPAPTPQPQPVVGYAYPYNAQAAHYPPPPTGANGYAAGGYTYNQPGGQVPGQYANPYLYAGYAQQTYNPHYQGYNATQYRSELQWQQPYQGPSQFPQYRVGTVDGVYYPQPAAAPDKP